MSRTLDLTSLRSFVAVADAGGVTRAAGLMNLTQSAVSMQIKRLEDALGLDLLDRSGRRVALTAAGEQLLGYARRMLSLNDELFGRLTHDAYEGEIVLGVPHDIVHPAIPGVLRQFNADFPRMRVSLISSYTLGLKERFARGGCAMILTTEETVGAGGETLVELPLVWVGAAGGAIWRQHPLRLAFEYNCIFRQRAQTALDTAGLAWEMAVESDSSRTIEASVGADLAVHACLAGCEMPHLAPIPHGGALPELGRMKINLYVAEAGRGPAVLALADLVRTAFAGRLALSPAA